MVTSNNSNTRNGYIKTTQTQVMATLKPLKHKQWLLQNNSNTSNGFFKTTQTQGMSTFITTQTQVIASSKQLKHK